MRSIEAGLNEEAHSVYGRNSRRSTGELLFEPILKIATNVVVTAPSSLSLGQALDLFNEHESSFILVQDSPDTILGVVSRAQIDIVNEMQRDALQRLTLFQVLESRIIIEPDTVTVDEVLNRLSEGEADYTVIVDRLGRPQTVVSIDSLQAELAHFPS